MYLLSSPEGHPWRIHSKGRGRVQYAADPAVGVANEEAPKAIVLDCVYVANGLPKNKLLGPS